MNVKTLSILLSAFVLTQSAPMAFGAAGGTPFSEGVGFYGNGRFSEATESFELAIKKRDHEAEARAYIERIRKETVDRIRNKALTGVSKANWQSKFYYMKSIQDRVRIGISCQELFERDSLNFRPGAVEALSEIAAALQKSEQAKVDIELINEINQETVQDAQLTAQQLAAVFSYLSLAARDQLPKLKS